jgi:DNA repair exonuclease SbcCD ATPase subunit
MQNGLHIIRLEAENVKRLRAVRIDPEGNLVIVSGRNGAGKSTTLDCIEMLFGGADAIPEAPIRDGARRAKIVGTLEGLTIERTFSAAGSKLRVLDANGAPQKSPQGILNQLFSKLTFDPLEFSRMKPPQQAKVLRELLGLDFSELDSTRSALFAERSETNRDVKRLEGQLSGMPEVEVPEPMEQKAVVVGDLIAELDRRAEYNDYVRRLRERRQDAHDNLNATREQIESAEEQIAHLQKYLRDLRGNEEDEKKEVEEATAAFEAAEWANEEEIKRQLATADETNRAIQEREREIETAKRAREDRAKVLKDLDTAKEAAEQLTSEIRDVDERKARMLAEAQYPVPGLGLDETGVTFEGLPFSQACTSAKIRTSIAIGAALNPKLRVLLVRSGNDLDADTLREVAKMAEEMDMQLWVEKIDSCGLPAVVIEDGAVLEAGAAAE